jgi:aminodeoxyfutalosine synthase
VFEVHVDATPASLPPRTDAGEFRLVGAPASLDAAIAAVRAAVALANGRPLTGFTVDALETLGPLDQVARALGEAGLAAIAQLPLDRVTDPVAAATAIRSAGLTINTITIEELADDPAARVEICERAQRLQAAVGGFHAFAPLPRVLSVTKPTTGYDDVKQIALARVVVENVPSIQVDWQLYGPKMAQVALTVGADDVDNVSAVDPGLLGTRRSPLEEIRTNIKAAALEAMERDGFFERR